MSTRNQFIDPAGNRATYPWSVNHEKENAGGKERPITTGGNTGGTGLIKQEGDTTPYIIEIEGKILEEAQYEEFWEWWALCDGDSDTPGQTIYYKDFTGDKYEVQITSFIPTKVGCAVNGRGGTTNPTWYWTYTMRMTVYKFKNGPIADAGVKE